MDNSTIAVVFAGIALALNLGQRVFGGGWNLSKNLQSVEIRLKDAINETKEEIEDRLDSTKNDLEQKYNRATHNNGDALSALKEHIRQVEFHLRDNYIRKDDFVVHMKQHDDFLTMNFASLTQRLERIEKTLDNKT